MLNNREFRIRIAKTNSSPTTVTDVQETSFPQKVAIIGHYAERGFKNIGMAVCAYVVADTVRQVIVAKASK